MRTRAFSLVAMLAACDGAIELTETDEQSSHRRRCDWTQFGGNAAHDGESCVEAQPLDRQLARVTIDPFIEQETAEDSVPGFDGVLNVHYQVPLIDGDDVFVLQKAGAYVSCAPPGSGQPAPCGPDRLGSQIWTEKALRWRHGQLEDRWTFTSDWKPPEVGNETMFQPALTERYLYVPGFGGSIFQVDRRDGNARARIQPFGPVLDPKMFVWGGLAVDRDDNIYYNAVAFDAAAPLADVAAAWLVKISPHGHVSKVDYRTLIPAAPAADALCRLSFSAAVPRPARPWPPAPQPDGSPTLAPQGPCGSQRPSRSQIPAIGRDGTIFVATSAARTGRGSAAFVAALRPDLTLAWATSLSNLLDDGCGVLALFCRPGATVGVDQETGLPPEGRVHDASSASPVALPDGGVLYGALTIYNGARGHLMKFDRHGAFQGSYDFGWDVTPAVYEHDGTYSIVTKDNVYFEGLYYLTQLSADLAIEWRHQATNPLTCERQPDGSVTCVDTGFNPTGFEWCVNAPVVDRDGTVYGTNGDGNFYAIAQGGAEVGRFFLDRTRAAAYTPGAIDRRGRLYAMNNGELFVLGD